MQLIRLHDDFYRIEDAFNESTLSSLVKEFDSKHGWNELLQCETVRLEGNPTLTDISNWQQQLKQTISEYFNTPAWPNTTQLWYDYDGYINEMHCDLSPNLIANVQIYLCDGDISMGTHCCIDGMWRSVPYLTNNGYLMFNPTKYEHGMKTPVKEKRMSLYQSFRITEEPSPIW